jgi:polysaccharide export outer membrane protein
MQATTVWGRVLGVLALVLVVAGCAGDRLQTMLPRAADERVIAGAGRGVSDYRLMVGDKVRVTQYDVATETGDYTVDPAGAIIVPPLAPLAVAGKTPAEAARLIEKKFTEGGLLRAPRVTVEVTAYGPVFVLGEVARPGEFSYKPGMSLLAAVAAAGGYTYRADKSRVFIRRSGDKLETVYDLTADLVVMPGDVVRVPEIYF